MVGLRRDKVGTWYVDGVAETDAAAGGGPKANPKPNEHLNAKVGGVCYLRARRRSPLAPWV